uniref:Uncharacterized protein n=1 Tax=Opuntia streptacantha TaxID=393608 RepID=A0A7C9DM88_OPUST
MNSSGCSDGSSMTSTLPFCNFSFSILALIFLLIISFSDLVISVSPPPKANNFFAAQIKRKPQTTAIPTLESFGSKLGGREILLILLTNPEVSLLDTNFTTELFLGITSFPDSISLAKNVA